MVEYPQKVTVLVPQGRDPGETAAPDVEPAPADTAAPVRAGHRGKARTDAGGDAAGQVEGAPPPARRPHRLTSRVAIDAAKARVLARAAARKAAAAALAAEAAATAVPDAVPAAPILPARTVPQPQPRPPLTARPPVQPVLLGAVPERVAPTVGEARTELRHWGIVFTFLLFVLLPSAGVATYLWGWAKDQYASTVAFSVRKEEFQSSLDILGGISKLSGSATSDTDILYEFIRSQDLVADIDAKLDLRAIYARAWPDDPVFAFNPAGTIEDLLRHWRRKVTIAYDTGTGLMTLRVLAFDPVEATRIAGAIFDESSTMINALSAIAREDATRYAKAELDRAVERLKEARQAMTGYRLRFKIVDPSTDLQGQMGVLNTLQGQLAEAMIELDLIRETAREGDPRLEQFRRRIAVIEKRIEDERAKFGIGGQGPGGEDYANIVAEFERLTVDREFAEQSYTAAQGAFDNALAEAQRQSRYLAAHIQPTAAERSQYPERIKLLGVMGFFLFVAWAIGVLIYYSVRDRR